MGNKRLSDVINYEEHISPYRIIEVVSGVGSGKNYWVENVLMEKYRVLLITSRKAKVEETMHRTGLGKCLNLSKRKTDAIVSEWDEDMMFGCCVCNNWLIEYYMKNKFLADDNNTHLFRFFDIIVVDEAHSLATDATYCDAPFYLLDFLKATYQKSNKKIILMTATPTPIENLISLKDKEKYKTWDFTKKCINVQPSLLEYVYKKMAWQTIVEKYAQDPNGKWHTVYFATRTKSIKDDIVPYLVERGIPEENIAVSFSDEKSKEGFSEVLLQNQVKVEKYLKTEEDIPDDIKVFVTTSRNKEGINMSNDEYEWHIVIESHWDEEIQQMWGRVRSPYDRVMLVYDAPQHYAISIERDFDHAFDIAAVNTINTVFDEWCQTQNIQLKNRYQNDEASQKIDTLHVDRFPYVRYSIGDDKFRIYQGRCSGRRSYSNSLNRYKTYINEWMEDARGERNRNDNIEEFFPIKSLLHQPPDNAASFAQFAQERGFFDRPISSEDKQELLDYVSNVLEIRQQQDPTMPYKSNQVLGI